MLTLSFYYYLSLVIIYLVPLLVHPCYFLTSVLILTLLLILFLVRHSGSFINGISVVLILCI